MGSSFPYRRRRRARLPAYCARYAPRPGLTGRQIRLAIWSGLLLGLLAFQAMRDSPVPIEADAPPPAAAFVDPYAESRRSRAILEAQEGAPPPVIETSEPSEFRAPTGAGVGLRVGAGSDLRVMDGDTFAHAGQRIRIADIDTPEVDGRCPEETALAAKATSRLRTLLAEGPFELHSLPDGRDRDRHGRQLRIVTRDGRSIGDVLVAEGLARTWSGRREGWCV